MKLSTVRLLTYAMIAVDIVILLAAILTKQKLYGYIGIVTILATGFFETGYYKCPMCGKFLGQLRTKKCPHCGAEVREKKK